MARDEQRRRSIDDLLDQLKIAVMLAGGEDAELWKAVETHGGVVYNGWVYMSKGESPGMGYYAFRNSKPEYESAVYDTWQEAAKDFLVFVTFGICHDPTNKS